MTERQPDPEIGAWLDRIDPRLSQALSRQTPDRTPTAAAALDDQPLASAICAHLEWRDRLEALLARGTLIALNVGTVSRDDACAIGRWLHGPTASRHAELPEFIALRAHHAAFHDAVGRLVRTAQQGDVAGARAELASPAHAERSWQVVNAIAALARRIDTADRR